MTIEQLYQAALAEYQAGLVYQLQTQYLALVEERCQSFFLPEDRQLIQGWLTQLQACAQAQERHLYARGLRDGVALWQALQGSA